MDQEAIDWVTREGQYCGFVAIEPNARPSRVSIDARTCSWAAEWVDGRTDSGSYGPDDIEEAADMTAEEVLEAVESELGLEPGALADAEERGSDGWVWTCA
jgi:hypothetical protein